jgi:hypothetical protein
LTAVLSATSSTICKRDTLGISPSSSTSAYWQLNEHKHCMNHRDGRSFNFMVAAGTNMCSTKLVRQVWKDSYSKEGGSEDKAN